MRIDVSSFSKVCACLRCYVVSIFQIVNIMGDYDPMLKQSNSGTHLVISILVAPWKLATMSDANDHILIIGQDVMIPSHRRQ